MPILWNSNVLSGSTTSCECLCSISQHRYNTMHYYFPVHWGVLQLARLPKSQRALIQLHARCNKSTVCYQMAKNTVLQQRINAISLIHAVISRSYPKPRVPVSWQIIHPIIIHLLEERNPQTSREFRLNTNTSHPCHLSSCLRFLVVIPKQTQ